MAMDVIFKEHRFHWSQQVSAVGTTRLQHDQTLSAKGVACKTKFASIMPSFPSFQEFHIHNHKEAGNS